jgi:ribosomal protein S18 acetylase RimI-like enzyme
MRGHSDAELLIRRALDADALLLAELGARTFYESFAAENSPEDISTYLDDSFGPEKQAVELAEPGTISLIAEIEGIALGYAQLRPGETPDCVLGPGPIELARIYVSQAYLGLGVGNALMRACIDEARRAGHQTMWLGVWERNVRAQGFYRKWNFTIVGEHIFQLGSDPQRDLLMERALT